MKYLLLTILFLGLSCKTSKVSTVKEIENLGSKFQVKKIEVSSVELQVKPTIQLNFEKNTIFGNAGCNNYTGVIIRKENQIKFKNLVATKMYCGNMKIEKEFLKKLGTITSFKVQENQFLLYNKTKTLVFTCEVSK